MNFLNLVRETVSDAQNQEAAELLASGGMKAEARGPDMNHWAVVVPLKGLELKLVLEVRPDPTVHNRRRNTARGRRRSKDEEGSAHIWVGRVPDGPPPPGWMAPAETHAAHTQTEEEKIEGAEGARCRRRTGGGTAGAQGAEGETGERSDRQRKRGRYGGEIEIGDLRKMDRKRERQME